jgi:hypothetical protein
LIGGRCKLSNELSRAVLMVINFIIEKVPIDNREAEDTILVSIAKW